MVPPLIAPVDGPNGNSPHGTSPELKKCKDFSLPHEVNRGFKRASEPGSSPRISVVDKRLTNTTVSLKEARNPDNIAIERKNPQIIRTAASNLKHFVFFIRLKQARLIAGRSFVEVIGRMDERGHGVRSGYILASG